MFTRRHLGWMLAGVAMAVAMGAMASRSFADEPAGVRFAVADPPAARLAQAPVTEPGLSGVRVDASLDEAGYRLASAFARRVDPYVQLDDLGIPRLAEGVTAAELGVDEAFLADFERALEFAGRAVQAGHVVVREDLTVEARGPAAAGVSGLTSVPGPSAAAPDGSLGRDASLDWQSWRYNSGAMFYNAYEDYWTYFHNRYYVLCSSMAAQIGYPWMSTNLVYFYTYNSWSFGRYCMAGSGMYWFMPYSTSGCYPYWPCYCCGVSYRPIYIWVVTYQYYPSCRCHQPVWGWQGYWARY